MPALSLVLEFKRNVDAKDIASSFETAFKKNNIADTEAIKQFKTAIKEGGDVKSGRAH